MGEATSGILPVTEGPKFFLDITKNYRLNLLQTTVEPVLSCH